jgi:DNA-directed RNA polymerase subunit beta
LRYGNKSVISKIEDDDKMPFTKDGRRVDLLLNLLAIVNRTTSFPMYELIATSIAYKVRNRLSEMDSYDDREKLLFDIIYMYNEKQYDKMKALYDKMDSRGKKKFIDDAITDGIYLNQPPFWETKPIFNRINDILKKYTWLQADDVYINKWGREIKILNKYWIGDMYILKLKQTDRKGFIVRSTGPIDTKGLPTKSYKSRSHLEQYSGNAIRFNNTRAEILVIVFSKTLLIAGKSL